METVTRFAERQAGSVSADLDARPRGGAHTLRDRELPAVGGRQEGVAARGRRRPRRPADPAAGARQPAAPRVGGQARRRAVEAQAAIREGRANVELVRDRRVAALRRAADGRRTLSGRCEESRTGERLLCRARRPALEAERRRSRPPRERRRGVPCGQGTTRRRPSAAIAQAVLHHDGARSLALRRRDRPRDARRRFHQRHTGAFARISEPKENAIVTNRAEQLALHEEKKRFIAEWVAANGTDEQKMRQAAGVLPMAEAIEGITDQAFAVERPPTALHARWR